MAENGILKQALQPLEGAFGIFSGGGRETRITPTETKGAPGTAILGGYVVENEQDKTLTGREKYKRFSEALANVSVVAAGVRYFLNLSAGAKWTFEPPEGVAGAEQYAELTEEMLKDDPDTTWARIVRRAAMYRFYGFSVQEWIMKRRDDGFLTYADIAPRPQITIDRWDVDTGGNVLGVEQTNPQNNEAVYLPRGKIMYLVDDTLNDSPEGLGLLRHIMEPVRRLQRYEQLEGFGFEGDLRGIPVGRLPYAELNQRVEAKEITKQQAMDAVKPIETFIKRHIKNPELGVLMDSEVFATLDDAARPSSTPKFDVKLLEGSQSSLEEVGKAIERLNLEIARVLGIESLLLGAGSAGSYALAREKGTQFSLTIDATLSEIADSVRRDLVEPLFLANGWPPEAMPKIKVEAVQYKDAEQITNALRNLAGAGGMLAPDDPVFAEIWAILGLEAEGPETDLLDLSLTTPPPAGTPPPDDDQPPGED